ncbi:trypsin-like peptidase domain-containing protein [Pseudomonas sp. RIT-PI-AD]|uniref:trypsin-like peptidase domain-containing protein n=1 Tax=Pseudomonas sp. RIT-PI-AD TaxID=3035294 RepID=UPI0021D83810|nr:trypsin-like peptidase domain-containing protein [Pseudomonas sp. RIT-PI-AD]
MKSSIFCCALLLTMTAQADSLGPLEPQQSAEVQAARTFASKSARVRPVATVIDLGPLSSAKKQAASAATQPGQPERIGVRRNIGQLKSKASVEKALNWDLTSSGGHVAAISLTSPEALSLRAALYVKQLPSSAVLRFYTQGADATVEVQASEILQTIARNLAAGDESEQAHYYWTPPLQGEEITLEIELPKGVDTEALDISVPALSHIYRLPTEKSTQKGIGDSGACNVDYACAAPSDATLDVKSRATAKMIFVDDGDSYLCSGTLLNNGNQDRTPYFLSANHCISTQTSASTLATYWFYRASACQGESVDPSSVTLSGGAQLLYHSADTDTAFLRLNDAAPVAATFAGWTTEASSYNRGQDVLGVHYPHGDLQKVSKGQVTGFSTCANSGGDNFTCHPSAQSGATFVDITWYSGVTEGGSSGSALFSGSQVVGQLYGGDASCQNPSGPDQYGLLAEPYAAALKQWLSPNPVVVPSDRTVVEFFNPDLNHYFITADPSEQAFVDTGAVGRWMRTGVNFKAGGSKAVCRFYGNTAINPLTGAAFGPNSHFYTADTAECDFLVGFFNPAEPSWKFESYDFNTTEVVDGACPVGTAAVYRLYNNGYAKGEVSNHRFTTDGNLANQMTQEGWLFEGVKMCAPL